MAPLLSAFCLGFALALSQAAAQTNLPAFPGALGFGARASGGRGGAVYHVKNLDDRGPGSLREGVEHATGPRTIVFDVGGYISLQSILRVGSDLTIAGQSAPGEGIGLCGSEVSFSGAHNIIVRHLRIRQGLAARQDKKSAVNITRGRDMVFDHVSIQWGRWDTVDMNGCENITFQDCIIGPGVAPQRFGCLCQCEKISFIRNLWISNQSRNPKAKGTIQYINNVVYNWGVTGFVGGHSGTNHYADLINNYFIKGPASSGPFAGQFTATDFIYQTGNWLDLDRNGRLDGRAVLPEDFGRQNAPTFVAAPTVTGSAPWSPDSAQAACEKILAGAGASLHRDAVDQRLIADLASFGQRGQTVRDPEEMGGFGTIAGGPAQADTDGDGLPDSWETAHGLNPKAADSTRVATSGYTYLEQYLNWLAEPHAVTARGKAGEQMTPAAPTGQSEVNQRIDRHALVARHDPVLRQFDPENPLSIGNGEFAFTADVTGLQTFAEAFTNTIPLGTLSQWGWHTFPNPAGWGIERFAFQEFESHGRKVGYADVPRNQRTPEINWLRGNPHRLHLGRMGLVLTKADGSAARPGDLAAIEQTLDLWEGVLRSRFELEGQGVQVQTVCHPELDLVAVRVVSPLLKQGRLAIQLHFPYGTGATATADWSKPEAHTTELTRPGTHIAVLTRRLDQDRYYTAAAWSSNAVLSELAKHQYRVKPARPGAAAGDALEFVCRFSPTAPNAGLPSFDQTRAAAREHWKRFWNTGGAIDLSASKDPRWQELERRIVLSQYLTAIQCAGSLPPQETGLTYNSWEGKFHLEMHWWHAAHFALWDRLPLLERSLGYYPAILPRAQATAKRQGYTGARWPKMTGPTGEESPSPVGPFLIWQQPHPIFYAELCYRAHGDRATLEKFQDVVSETAEFMSSYAAWDEATQRYVLGPPLQCAQEAFPKDRTMDPTFELAYWRWGLETAQRWRERLGRPRVEKWDRVLQHLARPPVVAEKYLFAETAADTYSRKTWAKDHPTVTAALGLLPGPDIDRETMRRTLHWIWDNWDWPDTWGWDYPMLAMCAARLGEPERAIDALLLDTPKNKYRLNGHNHQRPGLTIYLPGNGALLYAAAMMAAGWDGAPHRSAPGFPENGQWTVRWEGLRPAP